MAQQELSGKQSAPILSPTGNLAHTPTDHRPHETNELKVKTRSKANRHRLARIDPKQDRWPYCIVWTPLPLITWFIPFIGHTGIANSQGVIYDFSGDYSVTVDNFSFGSPTKYYQFQASSMPQGFQNWDRAIEEVSDHFSRTRHSLFFNNCHQFVDSVMSKVKCDGRADWSQFEVWWLITFSSSYNGFLGFARQWSPFIAILLSIIVFCSLIFTSNHQ